MPFSNVIYVEDESDIRTVVSLILSEQGINVVQFDSGAAAIADAQHHEPDLILMDFTMEKMDGIETLQRLREIPHYESTPCVFVTARIDQESLEAIDRVKNTAMIRKPFNPKTLVAELLSLIHI